MGRFSPLPALSDLRETRLEKAAALAALGQGPYGLRFEPTHRAAALQQAHLDLANGEERDVEVSVAGRVMTRRVMGKLAFSPWPMRAARFSFSSRRPPLMRPLLMRPHPVLSPTSLPW